MENFINEIKEKYEISYPVIYYLLDASVSEYHQVDSCFVESQIYQTEIKIQSCFYKPTCNIDI